MSSSGFFGGISKSQRGSSSNLLNLRDKGNDTIENIRIGVIGDVSCGKTSFVNKMMHKLDTDMTSSAPSTSTSTGFELVSNYLHVLQEKKFNVEIEGTLTTC
jgi:GTPase SAR1 family protein